MPFCSAVPQELDSKTLAFYRQVMATLTQAKARFVVGGTYALERYTGIPRHTKDLDLFIHRRDCEHILGLLAAEGYRTEITFPHWLGRVLSGDDFVDLIFNSGNGLVAVDDEWFAHAVADEVLGQPVGLCPVEEMIWSKGFIMERTRYDGADVAHLLRARGRTLDWPRLLRRFGPDGSVLFSHLVLFAYIYPDDADIVPPQVKQELSRQWLSATDSQSLPGKLCRGTLLSKWQYTIDLEQWGYRDARLPPYGPMTEEEAAAWTRAP
jgi:hypothetical protein